MNKHRILLVDDSPNELRIMLEVLKHSYAIVVATSGEQAINMVQADREIELVLLDVNMPEKDGFETCEEIHKIVPNLPIMFVSANDTTEEILKGFNAGAIDYITKPIDTKIVDRKVDVIVNERETLQKLEDENKNTSEMVMSVIASAGHLGTVLGFLRSGLKIKTHEGLLSALFDVFDGLNMDACAQLRTPNRVINRASAGALTPLEEDLLKRASTMSGRFLERGTRYIINFESISVIVKNMPVDDANLQGDLRDNLMMILEDTDALNQKLLSNEGAASSTLNAGEVLDKNTKEQISDIAGTMDMLSIQYTNNKAKLIDLFDEMNNEFEQAFFKLGLLEQQEELLANIVASKAELFNKSMSKTEEVEDAISALQQQLSSLVKNK
jgi:CheY-like chemotaxis protein